MVLTPITPSLRAFLMISGMLYLLWGILAIGLEVGLIINAYTTYYRGFWAGGFLIGGGISMLVAACKVSYPLIQLTRVFIMGLCFCMVAVVLSVINITASSRCEWSSFLYFCDSTLATNLKIVILVVFVVSVIHTIINMVVVNNARKRTTATSPPSVPSY